MHRISFVLQISQYWRGKHRIKSKMEIDPATQVRVSCPIVLKLVKCITDMIGHICFCMMSVCRLLLPFYENLLLVTLANVFIGTLHFRYNPSFIKSLLGEKKYLHILDKCVHNKVCTNHMLILKIISNVGRYWFGRYDYSCTFIFFHRPDDNVQIERLYERTK